MKKRILSILLVFVMVLGMLPVQVFATDTPTEPCITEGCIYGAGHEGNCSNYVAPTEVCATEGCTFGANHEGNCSNYVAPTEPCATGGCTYSANHEGNCSNYVAPTEPCATEGCTYSANHEGDCSNYVAPTEPCATEGCTYGANHEGNCSNYVEPSADELAAQAVIALIDAIGTVTRDSEAAIAAAHNAYSALTDAQKALVTNLSVLETAKTAYSELSAPVAPISGNGVVYTNGIDGSGWPAAMAYVNTVTLENVTVESYSWSGNTCTVTLAADTASDATVKFAVKLAGQAAGFGTTIAADNVKGTNVTLVNGESTVQVTVAGRGQSGTKTFVLSIAGGGVKNDPPALKEGVDSAVTDTAYIGVPYVVDLSEIFMDPEGDTLSFTVKENSGSAKTVEGSSYSYTPDKTGKRTLEFFASDGVKTSETSFKVTLTVEEPSLSLDLSEAEVDVGNSLTLNATVVPANAVVTWTSSDENIATVENGVVTPKAEGKVVITATAAGKSAACNVTVHDPSILKAKVTVTGSKGGTLYLVNASVTVKDLDGDGQLSYDEALVAAHETYCPGGYASDWGSFGKQVGKLWGEGDGYFANALFYNNDEALQMNVAESYVQEGDRLYACSLKYSDSWNDAYTYFSSRTKTVYTGEEFTLKLNGSSYMGGALAFNGLQVGTWSNGVFAPISGKTFDSDGNVTLSFDNPGTYIVTAEGEYHDDYGVTPIMPPVCVVTVKAVEVESVTMSQSELTMILNSTATLTATVLPANAANKSVTWTSSDETVATVKNGVLTANRGNKEGTTTITATTANGKTATCLVTVTKTEPAADATISLTISKQGVMTLVNAPVTASDLNCDGMVTFDEALVAAHEAYYSGGADGYGLNIDSGWVYKFWGEDTVDLFFAKNDVRTPQFVHYPSSKVKNGDRLYVGFYMKKAAGGYSYKDLYTMFAPSSVTAVCNEEIELTLTGFNAMMGKLSEATAVSGVSVGLWKNGTFEAIEGKTTDENGKVTLAFDKAGTYVVTAFKNDDAAPIMAPACVVTVTAAANEEIISLDNDELSMVVGEEKSLVATVTPAGTQVEWTSSDAAVATVENGKVTALKSGTATITAKAGSATATCEITVTESTPEYFLSDLKFGSSSLSSSQKYVMAPEFSKEIREYTIVVPDSESLLYAWATLEDNTTGAIVANYTNSYNQSKSIELQSGKSTGTNLNGAIASQKLTGNTITVTIGGETAYTVNILRQATLKSLGMKAGELDLTLSPAFSSKTFDYTLRMPYDKDLSVAAESTVAGGTIAINDGSTTTITPVWNGLESQMTIRVSNDTAVAGEYTIKLEQMAVALEILTPPTKTEYEAGDKFKANGMTLQATYSDGSTEIIEKDRYTYAPDGKLDSGVKEIEVSFDGLTVKQPITMPEVFAGSGTQEDPYLIQTVEDLVNLSELVKIGDSFEGKYLKMTADITLPADWTPLGISKTKPFSGNFDGGNHLLTVPEGGQPLIGTPIYATLRNLNIYGSEIAGYGVVNNYTQISAVSKSIIVIDNVALKSGTKTLKSGFIGGYASGMDKVTIQNCTIEKGVTIGYSKSESRIGSFAGEFNGTISNCVSYADVYGKDYVGGIVATKGQTMGDFIISGCEFHGTVTGTNYVGGIVGHGYPGAGDYTLGSAPNAPMVTIKGCVCSGTVTGSSYVGGILGAERAAVQVWANGVGYIQNNRFTGKVSGGSFVGGIIGYFRSLNKYTVITGNYYATSCGATKGIGGVEYVDTNCTTHETASGATYLNTASGVSGLPEVAGCDWEENHNRTDDPLGADASKLCYTDTQAAPVATELKISGTSKTEYIKGEELDLTGIELTVVYNDGSTKKVELKDVTVTGYDKTKVGEQTVTLSYGGLTADVTVIVKNDGKITVTVAVLGDSKHNSDTDGKVHNLASGNLTTWVSATQVELEGNVTAWDAIKTVLDEKGLSYSYSYSAKYGSVYIESVKGLGEFTNGKNSGWLYSVNGKQPNVGTSAYYLEDGDKIVLHYTDDYTKGGGGSINSDEVVAEKVEKLIDAIGTVTLKSKEKIEDARKAYDNLTYAQKQLVTNYSKLTDAEAKYAQLKADDDKKKAEKVEDLIDSVVIGSETFEEDVLAAQKAYNKLTADQKKLVGNHYKLVAFLKELAELEDIEAAQAVEKLIAAIGTVTKDSGEKIKAARTAYEELTDEQKALVKNLAVLEAAEAALKVEKQLQPVVDIHMITGDYMEDLGTPIPGSVGGEWMVVGLIRADRELKNADEYYDEAVKFVQENADENNRLHRAKSTENARMILALTAMGKDVTDVDGHNLLEGLNEMDYIRKQGINGPIWALIAFDSGNYPTPEGDVSRESLIDAILEAQLQDKGWALSADLSDPDMTGMALQALAPYYQTNEAVAAAVDAAVETLSQMQASDGSFAGIDGKSSESIAQVIVALSALGIDAHTDARFVKNGVSALEALCAFYVEGGGFRHIPEGDVDGMATEQAYYALTAYFRMREGKTALYDMTDVVDMGGDKAVEVPAETEAVETQPEQTQTAATKEEPEEKLGFFRWIIKKIFGK